MSLAVRIVARSEPTKTLRANDLFTEARGMEYLARVKLGKIDGRCRNDLGQGRNRLAGALAFQLSRRFSVVINEEAALRARETGTSSAIIGVGHVLRVRPRSAPQQFSTCTLTIRLRAAR